MDYLSHIIEKVKKKAEIREFMGIDRNAVSRMNDKDLAAWQAGFRENTPNWILAEYEWQRRLFSSQNNATIRAAILGLLGTLLGTILGFALGMWVK